MAKRCESCSTSRAAHVVACCVDGNCGCECHGCDPSLCVCACHRSDYRTPRERGFILKEESYTEMDAWHDYKMGN